MEKPKNIPNFRPTIRALVMKANELKGSVFTTEQLANMYSYLKNREYPEGDNSDAVKLSGKEIKEFCYKLSDIMCCEIQWNSDVFTSFLVRPTVTIKVDTKRGEINIAENNKGTATTAATEDDFLTTLFDADGKFF